MKSLSSAIRWDTERYECHQCDKCFDSEEIEDTWKCPVCKSLIHIYAEDKASNTKAVLLRMPAKEVEVGNLVILPGGRETTYQILGINPRGAKLGFGLKGYGELMFSPEAPVTCRTGAW